MPNLLDDAALTLDSDYADPNRFALVLWILQLHTVRLILLLEGL